MENGLQQASKVRVRARWHEPNGTLWRGHYRVMVWHSDPRWQSLVVCSSQRWVRWLWSGPDTLLESWWVIFLLIRWYESFDWLANVGILFFLSSFMSKLSYWITAVSESECWFPFCPHFISHICNFMQSLFVYRRLVMCLPYSHKKHIPCGEIKIGLYWIVFCFNRQYQQQIKLMNKNCKSSCDSVEGHSAAMYMFYWLNKLTVNILIHYFAI